jgi:hypothetical protein
LAAAHNFASSLKPNSSIAAKDEPSSGPTTLLIAYLESSSAFINFLSHAYSCALRCAARRRGAQGTIFFSILFGAIKGALSPGMTLKLWRLRLILSEKL